MKPCADTRHHLGRAEFLQLRGRPVRLSALRGTLWITQDGEPDDIQLEQGQAREFEARAKLTVGTLGGDAELAVAPQRPARVAWWRVALQWANRLPRVPGVQART